MKDIRDCPLVECFVEDEWVRVEDIAQLEANDIIRMRDRRTGEDIMMVGGHIYAAVRQSPMVLRRVLMLKESLTLVSATANKKLMENVIPLPTSIGNPG